MRTINENTHVVHTTTSGREYVVRHHPRSFDQGVWEVRDRTGVWCGIFSKLTSAQRWANRH